MIEKQIVDLENIETQDTAKHYFQCINSLQRLNNQRQEALFRRDWEKYRKLCVKMGIEQEYLY